MNIDFNHDVQVSSCSIPMTKGFSRVQTSETPSFTFSKRNYLKLNLRSQNQNSKLSPLQLPSPELSPSTTACLPSSSLSLISSSTYFDKFCSSETLSNANQLDINALKESGGERIQGKEPKQEQSKESTNQRITSISSPPISSGISPKARPKFLKRKENSSTIPSLPFYTNSNFISESISQFQNSNSDSDFTKDSPSIQIYPDLYTKVSFHYSGHSFNISHPQSGIYRIGKFLQTFLT